jgi:hypothetical protein
MELVEEDSGMGDVEAEKIRQLEARADKQDGQLEQVVAGQAAIRVDLAGLQGEIRGALAASKISGAVIGALVSTAGAGAVALLMFLLQRKP